MTGIVCTLGTQPIWKNGGVDFANKNCAIARFNGSWINLEFFLKVKKKLKIPLLMDLPGNRTKPRAHTFTDDALLEIANHYEFDYIGLSYIDSAKEIDALRKKTFAKILAKIETKKGYKNFREIIQKADIILIDRGDLGTAIGYANVPAAQEKIIKWCKHYKTKVVVATEMMMSTINDKKPSCADVTDVWLACKQGADYLQLSEETAINKDPLKSIMIMKKVIEAVK